MTSGWYNLKSELYSVTSIAAFGLLFLIHFICALNNYSYICNVHCDYPLSMRGVMNLIVTPQKPFSDGMKTKNTFTIQVETIVKKRAK